MQKTTISLLQFINNERKQHASLLRLSFVWVASLLFIAQSNHSDDNYHSCNENVTLASSSSSDVCLFAMCRQSRNWYRNRMRDGKEENGKRCC